jgi:hypothetical protein
VYKIGILRGVIMKTNLEYLRTCDKESLIEFLDAVFKGKEYQNAGVLEIFESRENLSEWLDEPVL